MKFSGWVLSASSKCWCASLYWFSAKERKPLWIRQRTKSRYKDTNYFSAVWCLMTYTAKLLFHQCPAGHSDYIVTGHCGQWHCRLDSDSVITANNCQQHGDGAVTMLPVVINGVYTVTVQSLCSHCILQDTDGIGVLLPLIELFYSVQGNYSTS